MDLRTRTAPGGIAVHAEAAEDALRVPQSGTADSRRPLRQGMKVAITGETAHARAELVGRSVAAGLNMMSSVSRHTSALVTNEPASDSAKARRALAEGVPVIDEHTFLRLLADVRPGTVHEATAVMVAPVAELEAEPVVGPWSRCPPQAPPHLSRNQQPIPRAAPVCP